MHPVLSFLLQLSAKAWAAVVVSVVSGGTATVIYLSAAKAASDSPGPQRPDLGPEGPARRPGPRAERPQRGNSGPARSQCGVGAGALCGRGAAVVHATALGGEVGPRPRRCI